MSSIAYPARSSSAQPYLTVTATNGIDPTSGIARPDDRRTVSTASTTRDICPAWPAGDAAEPAFEAATGLLYIAASRLCMDMEARDASFMPGRPIWAPLCACGPPRVCRRRIDRVGCRGRTSRVGSSTNRPRCAAACWHHRWRRILRHARRQTEGGRCTQRCATVADAASSGVVSRPTAFRGPDGKTWLAVLAGAGPLVGMPSASEIDMRDATAAKGFTGLLHDLPPPADRSGMLYVFRLP